MNSRNHSQPAWLVLESGHIFQGQAFGASIEKFGEVVFNTSITGYQEILSDPSYCQQIIVMTQPQIGNVGTNLRDAESSDVFCQGFVVRQLSPIDSSWRSESSLHNYLKAHKVPGISGIDTRALTLILREKGVMRGAISSLKNADPKKLLAKIKTTAQMTGQDLVQQVTCAKSYKWKEKEDPWGQMVQPKTVSSPHVVVMDFGAKYNILRCLTQRGARCTVVPATASAQDILKLKPQGLMLSNGPGDPSAVTYAIKTLKQLIDLQLADEILPLPTFGICLGHQLLGLALGGRTFKLKFGHRGCNHPVKDLTTGKIEITTQNHGFCVDIDSLKDNAVATHINLNDQTLEGLKHKTLPLFSVQYHPEAAGGPHDSRYLFDKFFEQIYQY